MSLRIVHYNDPVLRKKGARVTTFDAALRTFAADMIKTMHKAGGIGLAAQQVDRAVQLCVVDLRESDADYDWELDGAHPPVDLFMPMVIANPVITIEKGTPTEVADRVTTELEAELSEERLTELLDELGPAQEA